MLKYIFAVLIVFALAVAFVPDAQAARGGAAGCAGSYTGCSGVAGERGVFRGHGPVRRILFGRGPVRRLLFGRGCSG